MSLANITILLDTVHALPESYGQSPKRYLSSFLFNFDVTFTDVVDELKKSVRDTCTMIIVDYIKYDGDKADVIDNLEHQIDYLAALTEDNNPCNDNDGVDAMTTQDIYVLLVTIAANDSNNCYLLLLNDALFHLDYLIPYDVLDATWAKIVCEYATDDSHSDKKRMIDFYVREMLDDQGLL